MNFDRSRITERLAHNVYHVDSQPHIKVRPDLCPDCLYNSCVYICPAGCFEFVDERIVFSYEGCLECGSCLIACDKQGIEWNYPRGGNGVSYQLG